MGKNDVFRLPPRPEQPIVLNAHRYDKTFRNRLYEFISNDLDEFPADAPTYHRYIIQTVAEYAKDLVNVDELSLKNFTNYLSGITSHHARIQVLDAFVQIINPQARKSFFADSHILAVGKTFESYLSSRVDDKTLERYRGGSRYYAGPSTAYAVDGSQSRKGRYLYLKPSRPGGYMLLYEFDLKSGHMEQMRLVTGIGVPQLNSTVFVMRDYLARFRRVGRIRDVSGEGLPFGYASDVVVEFVTTATADFPYDSTFYGKDTPGGKLDAYTASRVPISSNAHLRRNLAYTVNNLGDVF